MQEQALGDVPAIFKKSFFRAATNKCPFHKWDLSLARLSIMNKKLVICYFVYTLYILGRA